MNINTKQSKAVSKVCRREEKEMKEGEEEEEEQGAL